ncbi:hypothetical protein M758_12G138100 [Ceratodon purpureus]|nr:hypothetical protein M758_12G138100 [Ceratodon purpureus]
MPVTTVVYIASKCERLKSTPFTQRSRNGSVERFIGWRVALPWQTKPLGTAMRHFWGMPRAMRGTTPFDFARGWLSREHRHLAPGSPLPMLAMLVQHCLDGMTFAFLLAAMHGTSWKMSHPAA